MCASDGLRYCPSDPNQIRTDAWSGESFDEVVATMQALRTVDCQRLTLGQYLRPSLAHIPVARYWHPDEFEQLGRIARELGFADVRSGPLVRSSYHAAG